MQFSIISAETKDICGYKPQAEITIENPTGEKTTFTVGIANNPQSHAKGLMYCKKLQKSTGLFFIFNEDKLHYFWMKNTPLTLAIIYIDRNFNVVSAGKGVPMSTKMVPSLKPARYVLEVNWEEGKSIRPGDKVVFKMK